ncbi:GNAT family N-acetyltransferase [Knoellia sp. CPCC 206450]|uniref:GNAT family N-acetyltransferase n=1 Tax=Knoellia tibetensis TaxID=3404798 RepID=UPI003B4372D4
MSRSGRGVEPLQSRDELVAATADHAFARFDLAPTVVDPGLRVIGSSTVAWAQHWSDGRLGVIVLGDPDGVTALAAEDATRAWVERLAPDHVTAPADAYEPLREGLDLRGGNAWDRTWTTTPPPAIPAERDVAPHDGDDDELTDFVRTHNQQPHALPGRHPDQRWVVVRQSGRLVACGCTEPGNTDVPLIGGIVVDRTQRGRGLGAAVTAYLTRDGLERTGACTLGVFADNDHARGLYERLGYAVGLRARTGFPVRAGSRGPSRVGR